MKALFYIKASIPTYDYTTEGQAQKEYKEYLKGCERLASEGFTSTMMWLDFEQWLVYMEFHIY